MAKKVTRIAKLQFNAGQAKPGPELAGLGIDMAGFSKEFNAKTKDRAGDVVPVVITAYDDRSYEFILKTTPASVLLKRAAKIDKAASSPSTEIVATVTLDDIKKIAEYKLLDLNTDKIESAMEMIIGTARNMGIKVEGHSGGAIIIEKKRAMMKEGVLEPAPTEESTTEITDDKADGKKED